VTPDQVGPYDPMEGRTVAVIEDDDHIAELLQLYLGQAGFEVVRAATGHEGLALLAGHATGRPALAIVDIGLPGEIDGLEVCRRVRAGSGTPVVLLTARGDETDRVVGLELGADDYVTKPFSPRELVARIKAILRRTDGAGPGGAGGTATIAIGDVEVDLARHEARRGGRAVELTPREFALLAALAENRGIVLSRRQLLDLAWGHDWYGDERTVDVHVRQLRRKLGDGLPLATLRRAGYRLG
jgi:two-component system, OmpR family, alkaline phosphatase synthesis response regulator PhoP